MKRIRAYIDTNVVLDFCWKEFFSDELYEGDLTHRIFLKAAIGDFEAYISQYTIIEVGLHFNDWFLLQKCIRNGLSYHQFKAHKKEYRLTAAERGKVQEILAFLKDWEGVNLLEIEKIEGKFFEDELPKYLLHSVEFMDALHLNSAVELKCTHLVTKDGELRKRIEDMKKEDLIPSSLRPVHPNGFSRELSRLKD